VVGEGGREGGRRRRLARERDVCWFSSLRRSVRELIKKKRKRKQDI